MEELTESVRDQRFDQDVFTRESDVSWAGAFHDAFQEQLKNLQWDPDTASFLSLAVHEAIANAIKHGNKNDKTKTVTVEKHLSHDKAVVIIRDQGAGFDADKVPDPTLDENLLKTSGRGLALMRTFCDEVDFHFEPGKGTEVTLVKYREKPSPEKQAGA